MKIQISEKELSNIIQGCIKNIITTLPNDKISIDNPTIKNIIKSNIGELLNSKRNISVENLIPLEERSINSILRYGENGYIVISACIGSVGCERYPEFDLSQEFNDFVSKNTNLSDKPIQDQRRIFLRTRNKIEDKNLEKDIKTYGLSFSKVYGGYREEDGDVNEMSFIIYATTRTGNITPSNEFFEIGKKLCEKYKQDSFLFVANNAAPNYYNYKGEKTNTSSSNIIKINRENTPYYTTPKRKKINKQNFSYDIQFENLYKVSKLSPIKRQMLESEGEIFI